MTTIVGLGEVAAHGVGPGGPAPEDPRRVVLGPVSAQALVGELWVDSGAIVRLKAEREGKARSRKAWRAAMKSQMRAWEAGGLELQKHVRQRPGERWRTFLNRYREWSRVQAKKPGKSA